MKYYNVKDVMEITGKSQNKSYKIIQQLNKQFKKKYPDSIPIQGSVPTWYFDKAIGLEEKDGEKSEKETSSQRFS
jgi:hypothetical protein